MERSEMIRTNLLGWSGALAVSALVIAACSGSTNGVNRLKGSSLMTITLSLVNGTPTDALLTLGKTAAGRL
jgi:hypothetical protein